MKKTFSEKKSLSTLSFDKIELSEGLAKARKVYFSLPFNKETNERLLHLPLDENPFFRQKLRALVNNYYHLDCFITPLPDGNVLLLNKALLSKASLKKIQESAKPKKVIDLAYNSIFTKPITMNLVSIPSSNKKGFKLLGPTLPKALIDKINAQGYETITPQTIFSDDTTSTKYLALTKSRPLQKRFGLEQDAENVYLTLETPLKPFFDLCFLANSDDAGAAITHFLTENLVISQLLQTNPFKIQTILHSTGRDVSAEIKVNTLNKLFQLLHDAGAIEKIKLDHKNLPKKILLRLKVSKVDLNFKLNYGGPHCMTLELSTHIPSNSTLDSTTTATATSSGAGSHYSP